MLGPMGSSIISILRVLTPGEIDRYTEDESLIEESSSNITAIASGGESFEFQKFDSKGEKSNEKESKNSQEDVHEAKIIPINSSVDLDDLAGSVEHEIKEKKKEKNKKVSTNSLEAIGIESSQTIQQKERDKIEKENSEKESTSVFILNQREKLKNSQSRLVEQAAILEYKKSATQEVSSSTKSEKRKDTSICGTTGILINKKHY